MEILEALARDRLEKEIAAELDLRLDTVKKHVAALKRLLGARTRIGVVLRAIEEGWVEPRSPPPSHRAVESMT
jgi:DNA-binding NarL/FixJ family response regulator